MAIPDVPSNVGRLLAFSPGWLENQSIWLHMTYKFLLELLRGRLYDEFYAELTTNLVPFMNASVYGRSPLEATSYIVSSAFPDASLHGKVYTLTIYMLPGIGMVNANELLACLPTVL
jgi:hypothetical protein